MSSIHSGPHTQPFSLPSEAKAEHANQKNKRASEHGPSSESNQDTLNKAPATPASSHPIATPSTPVPSSPTRGGLSVETRNLPPFRTQSARPAPSKASLPEQGIRTSQSEPAQAVAKRKTTPTEYQEHFYELGSMIVDPRHNKEAQALAKIIDRKEGLKIYLHEPQPGQLYAISHSASELTLPDGKSTQHRELQKALLLFGVGRGVGRFATENPAQRAANKELAKSFLKMPANQTHGGLRLQKHEGRYVIDVSSSFSFHGASDASMDHIARFYATVLRFTDDPPESVGVIPAEASCNKPACIEAATHLQELAKRITAQLDD